jgi:hypothetical protein
LKVVSFESARVTWLFPLEEFAPAAGANSLSMLTLIAQRYGFSIVPTITTREDLNKNGLVFGMGRFQHNGQTFVVTDFGVYNDGLAAVAQKSEWAEAFLEDVTSWVKNEFDFREVAVRKLYSSSIIVDFETPPSRLIKNFKRIADFISDRTVTIVADRKQMEFARLDFEVDRNTIAGQVMIPKFAIERRSGINFAQERYYSNAPMRTADHIETLEEIERVAAGA